MPDPEPVPYEIPPRETVTTWAAHEEGKPYQCRILHKPTGITIESDPAVSAEVAREQAANVLRKILAGS